MKKDLKKRINTFPVYNYILYNTTRQTYGAIISFIIGFGLLLEYFFKFQIPPFIFIKEYLT